MGGLGWGEFTGTAVIRSTEIYREDCERVATFFLYKIVFGNRYRRIFETSCTFAASPAELRNSIAEQLPVNNGCGRLKRSVTVQHIFTATVPELGNGAD